MKKYLQSLLFLFISTSLLVACGGGGSSSGGNNSPAFATELVAIDAIVRVDPSHISSYVNLRGYITSNSDEEIEISKLSFIQNTQKTENVYAANECIVNGIDGIGFDITIPAPTFCKYSYTAEIKNKGLSTSADIIVIASSNEEVLLAPVSINIMKNNGFIIDIAQQLGSDYPTGYRLQTGVLHEVIDGSTGNSFAEDLANSRIIYDGPNIGVYRLTYTLQGATADDIKVGSFFISVSDSLNQNITAGNRVYTDIMAGQTIDVELSSLVSKNAISCDSDLIFCDDDDIALLYVSVNPRLQNQATVTMNPNSMSLTFNASNAGNYLVIYVVTDKSKDNGENRGAFAVGMLTFNVKGASFAKWYPQYHNQYLFTAPLTAQEALLLSSNANRFVSISDPHYTPLQLIAAFNFSEAKKECETISGRTLPTSAQLSAFAQAVKPFTLNDYWPKNRLYWSSDNKLVNLSDGMIHEATVIIEPYHYVTCVIRVTHYLTSNIITTPKEGGFEINENVDIKIHVTDSFGKKLSGVVITAEITAGNGSLTATTATTDSNGDVHFQVTSAVVGDVTLRFIDGNMSITERITFISSKPPIPWNHLTLEVIHVTAGKVLPAGLNSVQFHTLNVCLTENRSGTFVPAPAGIEVQFFGEHPNFRVKGIDGQFNKQVVGENNADVRLTDNNGCISNYQIALTNLTSLSGSGYESIPFYVRAIDFNNIRIDEKKVDLEYSLPVIDIVDPDKTTLIFLPPLLCNGTCIGNDGTELVVGTGVYYRRFTWEKQPPPIINVWGGNEYCRDLVFGGYDDWRLPTGAELLILRDAAKNGLAEYKEYQWLRTDTYRYWAAEWATPINGKSRHYTVLLNGDVRVHAPDVDTAFNFVTCTRTF